MVKERMSTYSSILNANVLLRLESEVAKLEEVGVKSDIGELKLFGEFNG